MEKTIKKQTLSGVIWGFLENFSLQLFGFIQGVILARLLMPSDYGLIAMTGIFFAVSNTLIDSGFGSAIIRKTDRTEEDYSTVFIVNTAMSLVLTIILCLFSSLIADFYEEPLLREIVCINALQMFMGAFITIQGIRMTIELKFKQKSIINVITTVSSGICSIVMAFLGYGVWSLVYPYFISLTVRAFLFWHYQHWFPRLGFSTKSFQAMFSFGSKLLATSLIDVVSRNIYPFIIGKMYSSSDLGLYGKGESTARLLPETITGVVSGVSYPILSKLQSDTDQLILVYRRMLRVCAYIVFPIMIGLVVLAKPLVIALYTSKWSSCIIFLQIMCVGQMLQPIHSLNLQILQVVGRSDKTLRIEIIKKVLDLICLLAALPFGIIGICIGRSFTSFVNIYTNTYYTKRIINYGIVDQLKDVLPSFLLSIAMGGFIVISTQVSEVIYVKIVMGFLSGVLFYLVLSALFRSSDLKYILSIVKPYVSILKWRFL